MSFLFQPTRHAVDEIAAEAAWDPVRQAELAAELTEALPSEGWWRLDDDSFVSAGRTDGTATIVGNSGGWWLRCTGPGDMSEPMPSARDALAQAPKPAAP